MLLRFLELIDNAFDYEEALIRQNLKQEDVNALRDKIRDSACIPSSISDKQVIKK